MQMELGSFEKKNEKRAIRREIKEGGSRLTHFHILKKSGCCSNCVPVDRLDVR